MNISASFVGTVSLVSSDVKATSGSAFTSAIIKDRYKQAADVSTNNLRRQKVSTWIS